MSENDNNLGKPFNFSASEITASSISLRWEMNTGYDLIEGYWLKYKYNSFEPYSTDYIENQKFIRGSDPAYKLTGLRPNVTYEVWITPKGMVHADMGEASEKITVTTETAAPALM